MFVEHLHSFIKPGVGKDLGSFVQEIEILTKIVITNYELSTTLSQEYVQFIIILIDIIGGMESSPVLPNKYQVSDNPLVFRKQYSLSGWK